MTRRNFLRTSAALAAALRIKANVTPPSFPDRVFDITKFGAVSSGPLCTDAITQAVGACHAAGGGRVLVPPGRFLTGAVHLESNVNLHLADGSTLLFSQDPRHYPLVWTRFEGVECMNYSPFIYAFDKENIAVTGTGTLDGQASPEHWWPWAKKTGQPSASADRKRLFEMGEQDIPVDKRIFGDGHFLRPNFVQPYRCKNVLLEGFTIVNSPMWELNPVLSQNVTVRGVTINSHGPNNDGCDPDSSRDVLIEKCTFSTGDDCIAVKSGRNRDGRRVNIPCENVLIRDCDMKDGHGGVSIGSEVSGGIRNIVTQNCRMSSPNLQRALRIKTNAQRGGTIEDIRFEHVKVGQVAEAVVEVDFFYEEGQNGPFEPVVRRIYIEDVTSEKSKYGIFMRGFPATQISDVHIANCSFDNAAKGNFFQDVKDLDLKKVKVNGKEVTEPQLKGVSHAPAPHQ